MNAILKIVIQTGMTLYDAYKARKAREKAWRESPRSAILVQCTKCSEDVKADELSMSEHQRVCGKQMK